MTSLTEADKLLVCDGGGIDPDSTSPMPLPITGLMPTIGVNPTGSCDRRSISCNMITSSSLKRRGDFDLSWFL